MIDDTKLLEKLAESMRETLGASFAASELLRDRLPDDDTSLNESLAVLRHGQYRLKLISEQLGDLGAMREGAGKANVATVDVVRLCADLADSVSALVSFTGVRVRFECDRASESAVLDPVRIERMLTELLSNAVRHSEPGSAVTLALSISGEAVEFRVSDSGDGSAELVPGLGLASVEYAAKLHGGTIDVQSSPSGTTVTVSIPYDRTAILHLEAHREDYLSSAQSRLLTGLSPVLNYKFYMPPYL